jgi:flagellar M-ring protein FliF
VVHDTRLKLASQGLPKGGLVGFELMETQKLGVSQFAEQINYQRALEGELARSVQSLSAVRGARVHLAIPKQTAFLRDDQKASASVLVACIRDAPWNRCRSPASSTWSPPACRSSTRSMSA